MATLNTLNCAYGFLPVSEIEKVIRKLKQGTDLMKLYLKKPERTTMCVRLETQEILIWRSVAGRSWIEGAVDLHQVKEVRPGKNSKDFDRCSDETRKYQDNECFVILYGKKFTLKTLSCVGKKDECQLWIKGIKHLAAESMATPYPLLVKRYLRKEFYNMENLGRMITIKDLKAFLHKITIRSPTNRLRECFQDVDSKTVGEISFGDFASLYYNLVHDETIFSSTFGQYTTDGQCVTFQEFKRFLLEQQKDPETLSEKNVSRLMLQFVQDPGRDVNMTIFTIPEFLDFLFSAENDAFDPRHNKVNQDMTQPLVNYWIATSHNTYLLGDQLKSESSCEAYARCLRMGCRCIELDCWDGPDGKPFIFHGHTLTSKIKFMDVIRTIKEHAFVTSEYPVILMLENRCTLPQQREMATAFIEVFGDMLLTQPIDGESNQMPSPEQLKRKIILKHRKLPDGHDERTVVRNDESNPEFDVRNAIKNGILYLEDPINHEWRPHTFMLTQNMMYYTEECNKEGDEEDDDDAWGNVSSVAPESMPLGSLQKGSIYIVDCTVDITSFTNRGKEHVFRILSPREVHPIEIAAASCAEMMEWVQKIRETAQSANDMLLNSKKVEQTFRIAKELSDLIIYFRTVPFNPENIGNCTEMSSFSETKIEKYVAQAKVNFFLNYHQKQFSRVYPKVSRVNSSNYDPIKMWNAGVQMVALNYQTADRPTQLNHARFLQNGRCGYVLRPKCMFDDKFDPYYRNTLHGVKPITLSIQIISTRCLMKTSKGITSPFMEAELVGCEYDCNRFKSSSKETNALNPVSKESFTWTVSNPEFAIIKFVVQYEDMFSNPKFLAQAAYPVSCLRSGYRSFALKNKYCEPLELSSLLVHIDIKEQSQKSSDQSQELTVTEECL